MQDSSNPEADPAASEDEHLRWLVGVQKTEIGYLLAQLAELEGQVRRRTLWLVAAVVVSVLMALTAVDRALDGVLFAFLASAIERLQPGTL